MSDRLQIKFEFNSKEDRLLLRISQNKDESCIEYRFWLSRRFVKIFIIALDRLIEEELATNLKVAPESLDAMKKFQHEAAISKADFTTTYGEGAEHCKVFGEEPLLVTTLKVKKKTSGKFILSFMSGDNNGLHVTASIDLVHSLQKMLFDSVKKAAWNQPLFQIEAAAEKSSRGPEKLAS